MTPLSSVLHLLRVAKSQSLDSFLKSPEKKDNHYLYNEYTVSLFSIHISHSVIKLVLSKDSDC